MSKRRARRPVPPAGTLDELSVALGALQSSVDHLTQAVAEERAGAAAHRRDLREVIGALSGSVQTLAHQVAEMKPLVEDYRDRRSEARGAGKLVKALWLGAVGLAGAAGALIGRALDHVRWH